MRALEALLEFLNEQPSLVTLVVEHDLRRLGDPLRGSFDTAFVEDHLLRWISLPGDPDTLWRFSSEASWYSPLVGLGCTAPAEALGLSAGRTLDGAARRSLLNHTSLVVTSAFDDEGHVLVTAPTLGVVSTP